MTYCGIKDCGTSFHMHECRRCGAGIWCEEDGQGNCVAPWEGDNIGCPNEAEELAAEHGATS